MIGDPVSLVLLLLAAGLYAGGLRRAAKTGRGHPRPASVAFFSGLGTLAVALVSPLDVATAESFPAHMTQHLLLTLVAPPLLALGAPITLALRTAAAPVRRDLQRFLRSRVALFLANPVAGWVLFVGVSFGVHFSPLFGAALGNDGAHAFEHALWLSAALVYWWPIVGRDPSPRRVPFPARLLSLFLLMPAMSFLSLAIYSAEAPLYADYAARAGAAAALAGQQNAAVAMWLAGNLWIVLAMLVVTAAWKRDDERRERAGTRPQEESQGPRHLP